MTRSKRALEELDQQIREHLEREIQDSLDRGMPLEAARRAWIPTWIDRLWQDTRYGVRLVRRQPGFYAVAVLTIALGIGATTLLFSVAYGVLLSPLPWADADELVRITETRQGRAGRGLGNRSNGQCLAHR